MLLVTVVLLAALGLGWAFGGRLDRLGRLPLQGARLVVAAFVAQLAGALLGGAAYPVGLAVSVLLVGVFLTRNRGIRGTGLLALGLLGNAVVVGVNGAMPVSRAAAERAGVSTQDIASGRDPRHELADGRTRLRAGGDVIAVPLPLRPQVVSPGDVLVAAGLGQLVVVGMGARPGVWHAGCRRLQGGTIMAKRGRKRRGRKKNGANHGKRPNA